MQMIFTAPASLSDKPCPQEHRPLGIDCGYVFLMEEAAKRGWDGGGIDLPETIYRKITLSAAAAGPLFKLSDKRYPMPGDARTGKTTAAKREVYNNIQLKQKPEDSLNKRPEIIKKGPRQRRNPL